MITTDIKFAEIELSTDQIKLHEARLKAALTYNMQVLNHHLELFDITHAHRRKVILRLAATSQKLIKLNMGARD